MIRKKYNEVQDVLRNHGINTTETRVINYIWTVVDLLECSEPDYTVEQWYEDTKTNYPEDLEWLKNGGDE